MSMLIHHDGALGDVLLSLPCLRVIAREGMELHFTGRPDAGMLLREAGLVHAASSASNARLASLYAGAADPAGRDFLRRFPRAVVFTVNPESALVSAIRQEVPETRVIATAPPAGSQVHAAEFRLGQLSRSEHPDAGPLLPVPPIHQQLAAGMLSRAGYDGHGPLLTVHPGSGGKAKCWPLDRYLELLDGLGPRPGPFVILFTGPAEDDAVRDRVDAFARSRPGVLHYADADLSAVAAIISAADLHLGNDSGVSHLAAAVGCSVIALFGPTDPAVWRPWGPGTEVLRSADVAALSVTTVGERVRKTLAAPAQGTAAKGPVQERINDQV